MKKISLLLFLSVLCFDTVFANPVEPEKALETANNFWEQQIKETETLILKSPRKLSKAGNRIKLQEKNPQYYICTPESGKGFVIVAGEDMLSPIVGYSTEGFNENSEMPTTLIEWLNEYSMYVDDVRSGKAKHVKKETRAGKTAIAPMLKTTWNQLTPYNNLCPEINGQKTPTGCVATAMAQIMKFHEWPKKPLKDIVWHNNITNKEETINITAHTYKWDKMLDNYRNGYTQEQADAVAQLMVDIGKAASSNYSLQGTGSGDAYAVNAFVNVFDYSKAVKTVKRTFCTEDEYISIIRENLAAKKPVMYVGTGINYEGGHAFVCDGIDENDMLHIDWGWDGVYNGYFDMTYMAPDGIGTGGGSGAYNVAQTIIVNISPSAAGDINNAAPTVYKTTIYEPETTIERYNYTTPFVNNTAKLRVGIFFLNLSHSSLNIELALGIEENNDTYRILNGTTVKESLMFNHYTGYYFDFEIYTKDKSSNFYFEKGTHKLRVLYKNKDGNFVKMDGDQNRLMLDVSDSSAKVYKALPDINVSEINIPADAKNIGRNIKFTAKFINKNSYNSTIIIAPVINTTLSNGSVVHDTLKSSAQIMEVFDSRDIFVEFNTKEYFKHPGNCNITFAYNLSNYYESEYVYKSAIAESVSGSSETFTIKEETGGGIPVVTNLTVSNIMNGEKINISTTITNKTNKNNNYYGTLALAIRNTQSDEIYTLIEPEYVVLEKDKSITFNYKSADYFPVLEVGQYEVLIQELNDNDWKEINSDNKKSFTISKNNIAIPYICEKTNICGKSIIPGDSIDVIITAKSHNGVFDGYLKINTTYGLTKILSSNYIPVTISNTEAEKINIRSYCNSKSPDGKWDLIIKYYDNNKKELGTVSNNVFTISDNYYFWIGEPQVGIEEIESDEIYVTVNNGTLNIHGAQQGCEISIYSLDGRIIYNGYETNINVGKGLYIISINNETIIKTIVK